jgi:hypothetical protein
MMRNLETMLAQADAVDMREGALAYFRYQEVMHDIASLYDYPLDRVVAVFCALSPNSDYKGNLRSTVSVLRGLREGVPPSDIVVSTYNHCKYRAIEYAKGQPFLDRVKGPKITNFYHNILNPHDNRWVTIDGHMSAIWQGKDLTMKEAIIGRRTYNEIAHAVKALAFRQCLLPNQLQAILWFTRKRTARIKYDAQGQLFAASEDLWGTIHLANEIKPYQIRAGV